MKFLSSIFHKVTFWRDIGIEGKFTKNTFCTIQTS
jgi:hypothetical protein